MVKRWVTKREAGWKRSAVINTVGAIATAIVFVIILVTKFAEGGWMVALLLPIITVILFRIGGFYRSLKRSLFVSPDARLDLTPSGPSRVPIIVPVEEINLAAVMTVSAACDRSRNVTAVHVTVDPDEPSSVEERWEQQFPNVRLVIIDSPFRTVSDPLAAYVDDRLREAPHEVTVMVPVIEVDRWWHRPLVNQSLNRLGHLMRNRRQVQVVAYPFAAERAVKDKGDIQLKP
jgi:hypothetical protein